MLMLVLVLINKLLLDLQSVAWLIDWLAPVVTGHPPLRHSLPIVLL